MAARFVGLDFGTTNSALSVAAEDGKVTLATFALEHERIDTFRSILFCHPSRRGADRRPAIFAGPEALAHYLAERHEEEPAGAPRTRDGGVVRGRLIQSLKSHLASPQFTTTSLYGAVYTLEQLISVIVGRLRELAESELGPLGTRVRVGRPVRFVGAEREEHDALASDRLRSAVRGAGFAEVEFELEPVAAAWRYGHELTSAELVLIGDFGGGTSDFSLVRLVPGGGVRGGLTSEVLGTAGVGIGGDVFDGRLVHHLVAPRLGSRSHYRTPFGRRLPLPAWVYKAFERWHHLSFLRDPKTLEMLREIGRTADEPAEVRALQHVIEDNLGFEVYRAVERVKHDLTRMEASRLEFDDPQAPITAPVTRAEFESWIRGDLDEIDRVCARLLESCNVGAGDVDRVFLTGGSSLVPAVRGRFEAAFGAEKLRGGRELTSVAEGLALREAFG